MLRPRIIPCLLIHQGGLVKTVGFKNPKYVGDPINAVKIFNEKEADELIVLDIDATVNNAEPDYNTIAKLASECRMPLCYGGGIKTAEQANKIISLGVEKVALSSAAITHPKIVSEISNAIGRQSVVVVVDVKKKQSLFGKSEYKVYTHNGQQLHDKNLSLLVNELQEAGAGEIVINSIERDGQMKGYDLELAQFIYNIVRVPLTILGGAGNHTDIQKLYQTCGLVGAAAGSLFVFKGSFKAVLINYLNPAIRDELYNFASIK